MLNRKRFAYVAGGATAAVLALVVAGWQTSASHAQQRAGELLSASADMVRCIGGDAVTFEPKAVRQAFDRRMVSELPDVSTVGDCDQALETVKQKLDAYGQVWMSAAGSKGSDGQPLGAQMQALVAELGRVPYQTPSSKVLDKSSQDSPVRTLPERVWQLYDTASQLYLREGASQQEHDAVRDARLREARRVPPRAVAPRSLFTVEGSVTPERWGTLPADKSRLTLFAQSSQGQLLMAWSVDAADSWSRVMRTDDAPAEQSFLAMHGPGNERYYVLGRGQGPTAKVLVAKVPLDAAALPAATPVPPAPDGWQRPSDAPFEVIALPDGVLAFPVTKVVEKTAAQKRAEESQRKRWEKDYSDPQVQAEMVLDAARSEARKAQGLDDDHVRVDGIAYAVPGQDQVQVRELEGWGLGALVAGNEPMMLLAKGGLPALEFGLTPVPAPGADLGSIATAVANKPATPAYRGPGWYRCSASDGVHYGLTHSGTQLLGMRPGSLEIVAMTAQASERSHVGCGQQSAIVALPFEKDRIFASVLTIRGGEIEGARVATTAGTHVPEYNSTVTTGVVPGAVVVAWVTEGYVQYAVSNNWGTEFRAPGLLAEAGTDGSKLTGVRLVGLGDRLAALLTRESCSQPNQCTTSFELLVSDDAAKSWKGH